MYKKINPDMNFVNREEELSLSRFVEQKIIHITLTIFSATQRHSTECLLFRHGHVMMNAIFSGRNRVWNAPW